MDAGVEILNNFRRVVGPHPARKTITLIKAEGVGEEPWERSNFPDSKQFRRRIARAFGTRQSVFLLVDLFLFFRPVWVSCVSPGENVKSVQNPHVAPGDGSQRPGWKESSRV